jgi:branched-chain amino acid aminotransferase
MGGERLEFEIRPNPAPVSAAERSALLANPGFGRVFTDHMVTIRYAEGKGWYDARLEARGSIPMDPATAVLHYAQEIFEGLKAYQADDGGVTLFRPDANARRFRDSAARMAMAALPEQVFLDSLHELIKIDIAWLPSDPEGSLYLRPFMFANEVFLGVKPSSEYLYVLIASPVGSYFKTGVHPVAVWVSRDYTRAAPGGTGAAKCGGNYAASLIAQAQATENGCDQVVFLDGIERRFVEELGGMNIFYVFDDGRLITPPLNGTILPGITRDSMLTLAGELGYTVSEEPYTYDQWRADAASGRLREAFACGTAAVVTPISTVRSDDGEFTVGDGGTGEVTTRLRQLRPRGRCEWMGSSSALRHRAGPRAYVMTTFSRALVLASLGALALAGCNKSPAGNGRAAGRPSGATSPGASAPASPATGSSVSPGRLPPPLDPGPTLRSGCVSSTEEATARMAEPPGQTCLVVGAKLHVAAQPSPRHPWQPLSSSDSAILSCTSTTGASGTIDGTCRALRAGTAVVTTTTEAAMGDTRYSPDYVWELKVRIVP